MPKQTTPQELATLLRYMAEECEANRIDTESKKLKAAYANLCNIAGSLDITAPE